MAPALKPGGFSVRKGKLSQLGNITPHRLRPGIWWRFSCQDGIEGQAEVAISCLATLLSQVSKEVIDPALVGDPCGGNNESLWSDIGLQSLDQEVFRI